MRWWLPGLVVVMLGWPSSPVKAHSGGLDAQGCHTNRKTGDYHCHSGSGSGAGGSAVPKPTVPERMEISGTASVIDGDTLDIRGSRIRLHGVDAPESAQSCKNASGVEFRCGQQSALKLSDFINRRPVVCERRDTDRYGRTVAVCKVGGVDMNEWLVREGLAIAYRQFSTDYVAAEQDAKANKRGIWAGTFEMPADFRRRKP
jgi:endonuclease YncB( thermonuclease family)